MTPAERLYLSLMFCALTTASRSRQRVILSRARALWLRVPELPYAKELGVCAL